MSWSDPCRNCGEPRADCDCGDWNGYKKDAIKRKAKEEILKKERKDLTRSDHKSILAAMDEYAKQQAISFAEYVDHYVSDDKNNDMYWDNEGNPYNRNMLWNKFIEQQNK